MHELNTYSQRNLVYGFSELIRVVLNAWLSLLNLQRNLEFLNLDIDSLCNKS